MNAYIYSHCCGEFKFKFKLTIEFLIRWYAWGLGRACWPFGDVISIDFLKGGSKNCAELVGEG